MANIVSFARGLAANYFNVSGETKAVKSEFTDAIYFATDEHLIYVNGVSYGVDPTVWSALVARVDTLQGDVETDGSVAKSIKDTIDGLDIDYTDNAGKAVTGVKEEDGLITVKYDDINAAHVQVSTGGKVEGDESEANKAKLFTATAVDDILAELLAKINATSAANTVSSSDKTIIVDVTATGTDVKLNLDGKTLVADDTTGVVSTGLKLAKVADEDLDENTKEAFKLVDKDGTAIAGSETIKIYKDSSLKEFALVGTKPAVGTEGEEGYEAAKTGQFLKYVVTLADGTDKTEYVDVSEFLVEAEFKDGLKVNTAGEVSIKIDSASESFLTVGEDGLKLSGVQEAINAAKATATTVVNEKATGKVKVAVTTDEEDGHKIVTVTEEDIASAQALSELSDLVGFIPGDGEDDPQTVIDYVDKAIDDAQSELDTANEALLNELKAAETAVGLTRTVDGEGVAQVTYAPGEVNYGASATTVKGQLGALDSQLKTVSDKVDGINVKGDEKSVNVTKDASKLEFTVSLNWINADE